MDTVTVRSMNLGVLTFYGPEAVAVRAAYAKCREKQDDAMREYRRVRRHGDPVRARPGNAKAQAQAYDEYENAVRAIRDASTTMKEEL